MELSTSAFARNGVIPAEFAFGAMDAASHVKLSGNCNPDLRWSGLPAGTRSLVVLCHDPDAPSRGDDVNKEGQKRPRLAAAGRFFPLGARRPQARHAADRARGVLAGRYRPRQTRTHAPRDARQGINDYTGWFAGDKDMAGNYFGYDGPCPPWNDEIPHRYVFTLYALDVPRLPTAGIFGGADARKAMTGHILAEASVQGGYTLNPAVKL